MGSWLSRRRGASEELASLSTKMKQFRRDIEAMASSRRSTLWYLSLLLFFATTTTVAYCLMRFEQRFEYLGTSCGALVFGSLVLLLTRRIVNIFFDYRVRSKQSVLDDLIAKKKAILENVKETETFKVAKELLEKYDEDESGAERKSQTQPPSPNEPKPHPRGSVPAATPSILQQRQQMQHPNSQRGPAFAIPAPSQQQMRQQMPTPMGRPVYSPPMVPAGSQPSRPRTLAPIRPFAAESHNSVDKIVDYFFGDGPNQRFALICAQCHRHNGMAFPGEYEYLAYVCYVCGHFNPARKMRAAPGLATASAMTTPALSRQPSTRSLVPPSEVSVREDDENRSTDALLDDDKKSTDKEEESFEEIDNTSQPEEAEPVSGVDREADASLS